MAIFRRNNTNNITAPAPETKYEPRDSESKAGTDAPTVASGRINEEELSLLDDLKAGDGIELSRTVLPLPAQVKGKLLCSDSELAPVYEEGKVIHVALEHGKFLANRNGQTTIKTVDGELYANGATIIDYRRPVLQGCFVLKNAQGEPVVLCMQDRHKLSANTYFVYGRTPLFPGRDQPKAKQDKTPFYPWYRIERCQYQKPAETRAKISVWNGASYGPVVFLAQTPKVAPQHGKRQQKQPQPQGPLELPSADNSLLYIANPDGDVYARLQRGSGRREVVDWDVTIAPGADPALMLCATTILEEFVGAF